MYDWCVAGRRFEDNGFVNTCVFDSVLFSLSMTFLIVLVLTILHYWKGSARVYECENESLFYRNCLMYLTLAEAVLTISFSVMQVLCLSMLLAVSITSMLWIAVAIAIRLESRLLLKWPSVIVRTIFCVESLFYLLYSALAYADIHSTRETIENIIMALVLGVLAVGSVFKDSCLMQIRPSARRKTDLYDGSFISRSSYSGSMSLQNIMKFFPSQSFTAKKGKDGVFTIAEESDPSYSRGPSSIDSKGTRTWSLSNLLFGNSVDSGRKYSSLYLDDNDNPMYDPFLSDLQDIEESYESKDTEPPKTATPQPVPVEKVEIHVPIVESVLERHLYAPPINEGNMKTDLTIAPRRQMNDSESSFNLGDSQNPTATASFDGGAGPSPSRALQRALEQQRSRMIAANPGLVPRGDSHSDPSVIVRESSDSSQGNANTSVSPLSQRYTISIHRWGLRRDPKFSLPSSESTSNFLWSPEKQRPVQRGSISLKAASGPNGPKDNHNSDSDDEFVDRIVSIDLTNEGPVIPTREDAVDGNRGPNSSTLSPNMQLIPEYQAEIEFEICVSVIQGSGSDMARAGLAASEQEWWGLRKNRRYHQRGGGGGNTGVVTNDGSSNINRTITTGSGFWSVWKTASEVLSLHAILVGIMGDLAPRRPRLKSAVPQSTPYTRHEISDDMRAISAYLNATLRSPEFSYHPSFMSFLAIPENTPTNVNLNNSNGPTHQNNSSAFSFNFDDVEVKKEFSTPLRAQGATSSSNQANATTFEAAPNITPGQGSSLSMIEAKASNQQDKWRKLFVNMRMKLKPHEIAVRCRLFEGVVSGGDIAAFLIRPQESSGISYARDRIEAGIIGQELLQCGLIVAVSSGYEEDDAINHLVIDPSEAQTPTSVSGSSKNVSEELTSSRDANDAPTDGANSTTAVVKANASTPPFLDRDGYVYRFRERSATGQNVGCCTVFGAPVKVRILEWSHAEDEDEAPSRETMSLSILQRPSEISVGLNKEMKGHIEYLVDITHSGDNWQIWKRFREFEHLNKLLMKEGLRTDYALPGKTFTKAFGMAVSQSALDARKQGLELFLKSALETVVHSHNATAIEATAIFLDDEHKKLRLNV